MSFPTNIQSTEPPSTLQPNLPPVPLKYIPLPSPLTAPTTSPIVFTATETFQPPCRRCLLDAGPGEVLHLLSYDPFPVGSTSPYRGTSPIFVHANNSCEVFTGDKLPEKQLRRLLSVRAYDENEMLVASEVVKGTEFEDVAGGMLADSKAAFVMVHNAKPGCFAVRTERA